MWCARCQSDVAAEVSHDTRTVRCATCGTELVNSLTSRTESRTRQARALLERWSQERDDAPAESVAATPTTAPRETPVESPPATVAAASSHAVRPSPFDSPPAAEAESPRPESSFGTHRRIDATHGSPEQTPAPAAATPTPQLTQPTKRRRVGQLPETKITNWASTAGQWLAYSGILGLMAGTCLVILGYFRGPESYAPTGWLITTAGQMLLFLGVVTLVSSGIEESSNTVTEQIERLDAKLIRIEQATESLRPPHSLPQFEQRSDGAANASAARAGRVGIDR